MHIGYVAQNITSHYWLIVNHGARERSAELGITLTTAHATGTEQQLMAIDGFIGQRVDALLIEPNAARGLGPAVERARRMGIPVVVMAAEINDCAVDCTVRSDHRQGAELAAAYVVERLQGAGQVAHIIGPRRLQDNIDRADGVRAVFAQHPGIEVVFEQESPDWDHNSGANLMRQALERFPALRGVCVANDTLAIGAAGAIKQAGRTGEIVVTGFDAMADALIAINEGLIDATIRQAIHAIGRTGVDMANRVSKGETVPPLVLTEIALITRDNLLDVALDSMYLLPKVLHETAERGQALVRAREEIIQAQKVALRELSTPLIPINDSVTIMPLIGTIDTARAQQVIETLLHGVSASRASTAILDITGVLVVDTQVANALIQASQAVKLLGAQVILTGIRPEVAQTLVGLGVDLNAVVICATLQSGIAYAMRGR